MRKFRLRAVWLLIIPFYIYASPSATPLWWGVAVAAAGLSLRAWAAGSIRKDRELATTGPYAHTRNPLYLGSFMLGSGLTIAGGQWVLGLAFLAFFFLVYRATVRLEVAELEVRFGEQYRTYAAEVPAVLPRFTGYRGDSADRGEPHDRGEPSDSASGGFSLGRYMRNREWEAVLGAIAAFGLLGLKLKVGL